MTDAEYQEYRDYYAHTMRRMRIASRAMVAVTLLFIPSAFIPGTWLVWALCAVNTALILLRYRWGSALDKRMDEVRAELLEDVRQLDAQAQAALRAPWGHA